MVDLSRGSTGTMCIEERLGATTESRDEETDTVKSTCPSSATLRLR